VLLAEPPRTNYDLNFKVFGIPVRVHPFFWLVALLSGAQGEIRPKDTFIWMGALFVSILIHELGHAVAILYYGYRPWITLHWLGGLASHDRGDAASYYSDTDADSQPLAQIVIALAGPAAGFLFAGVIIGLIHVAGGATNFSAGGAYLFHWSLQGIANDNLYRLLWYLLFINILWGLINLLPVYPLDGGKVSRELFVAANPSRGIEWSLQLSIAAAIAMILYAIFRFEEKFFMVLLFGFLAFSSYQALVAYRGFGGRFGGFGGGRYGDDDDSYRGRGW
jgi:stage IV sporulation protein FB